MTSFGNFAIRYDNFISPYSYENHFHNAHELIYVRKGEACFDVEGKKYEVKKNSIIFINSFESHKSNIKKYPYSRYFILVDQKFLSSSICDSVLLSIFRRRPSQFEHVINIEDEDSQKIDYYFNLIYDAYNNQDKYRQDIIKSLFNLMIIDLYRIKPSYFPGSLENANYQMVDEVENYIDTNYVSRLTLSETAKLFNCDMYYLSHLFKKITGFGFKEYLINRRLSKAKDLLINTNISIGDVCINCGFNNINHFIRIFKQKEKITPLKFRKKFN